MHWFYLISICDMSRKLNQPRFQFVFPHLCLFVFSNTFCATGYNFRLQCVFETVQLFNRSNTNLNLECWFMLRGETERPGEKPLEQRWERIANSTRMWHHVWESNPGHIGERRALSSLCNPLSQPEIGLLNWKTENGGSWKGLSNIWFLISCLLFNKHLVVMLQMWSSIYRVWREKQVLREQLGSLAFLAFPGPQGRGESLDRVAWT